jgi:hypothetical protein
MAKNPWWERTLAGQLVQVQNLMVKVGGYAATLGLTPAQITALQALCDAFLEAVAFCDQTRQTSYAVTQWRDNLLYGSPKGAVAPAPPVFAVGSPSAGTVGVVTQIFEFRDLIVALPGYTEAIGEDLMIVGTEKSGLVEDDVTPALKITSSEGYEVTVKGSMQGMAGMRLDYRPKGGTFAPIAYLQTLPGSFVVIPTEPGEAETGEVRGIFMQKNEEFGNYSPNYPVTVA